MEEQYMERIDKQDRTQNNSRSTLAIVLIVIGLLWIFKQSGFFYGFPFVHFDHVFRPVGRVFSSLAHVVFSWPMIFIIIGLVLMAGKRSAGTVLLIIGGIFLLPKLFFFTGAMVFLFFPLLLIVVGIAIVARLL